MKEIWPNFLVIGAGKSGTTSLDYYLDQHPDIFMSPVKEPNFFGFELANEEDFESNPTELNYYRQSVTKLEDYLNLFEGVTNETAIGEISNTYLYHENAPLRIKKWVPNAKLIAILRQPAERLYSRFLHLARDNRLPTQSFSDCLDKESIWWERNDLVKEGFYFRNLSKFYDHFPKEQIKVFLFDDLRNKSDDLVAEIFGFLGVNKDFKPNTSVQYNSSGFVKNKYYEYVLGHNSIPKRILENIIPTESFKKLKKNQKVQKILTKTRERNLHKPKLDPETKASVTSIYKEDILKLSELIGRDLSHWL